MSAPNVIVFGPTGGVGSATALAAQEAGAKVALAMRDTNKPIPNLPAAGNFTRLEADLTEPASIRAAVTSSAAKHAFIYMANGSQDHMRSAAEALKSAGVEFVVFLSSIGVRGDIRAVTPDDFIAWAHAQVEIVLDDVFGVGGYVAVRPAYFASNLLLYAGSVAKGEVVRMPYPEGKFDYISPGDIGRVCGSLLVKGAKGIEKGMTFVNLAGPQVVPQREAIEAIGRAVGKQVEVVGFEDDEDAVRLFMTHLGLPEPGARQLIQAFKDVSEGRDSFGKGLYEEASANVQKYGGKEATTIQEWAVANRSKFT
ncbi:NAD(P)H azoreductase [Madurella mycetomatis]|uniref:NAD(P)H azoreductase n=1 Tax=Madurella mycetomatis TaxID=100816 RepID=A0A175WEU6_9PEZI|nr:NAD(P)H azoreductase [Madurella mycetomatis]